MNGDRPGTSRSVAPGAGPAVSPSRGSATPRRADTCSRDCSSRPPAAAAAPAASSDPAPTRNDRRLATSSADGTPDASLEGAPPPAAFPAGPGVDAGAPGSVVTSAAGPAERQARAASVATPARTPARAARAGRQAAVPGRAGTRPGAEHAEGHQP